MQASTTAQPWNELMQAMSLHATRTVMDHSRQDNATALPATITQAAGGCRIAQARLLRAIETSCYRYCLSMLANPDLARDATQETGLRVLQSLGRYRGEAALTTWALSIALNVCRETRRRQRRWKVLPTDWIKQDDQPGPQERADHNEQAYRLQLALELLPQRQREAVTLRYLQGLDTKQTARAMRCAEGTVKATLAKALTKLRKHWGCDDA